MRDTSLWTWHVAAGLAILVLGGLHMVVMHLSAVVPVGLNPAGDDPLVWSNVAWRARQAFFMITYIVLLGAGLFHGLYGLRNIILELTLSDGKRRLVDGALITLGVALMVFGSWAAVQARTVAAQAIAGL